MTQLPGFGAVLTGLTALAYAAGSPPGAVSSGMPASGVRAHRHHDGPGPDSTRVARFLAALGAGDPLVCEMAIDMLSHDWGWHGSDDGINTFRDRPAGERAARDSMSNRVDDRRAIPLLSAGLGHSSPCVRRAAAQMLGDSPRPEAIQSLRTAFGSGDVQVREAAAYGLGTAEDTVSYRALVSALQDAEPAVAQQSAWALGAIEDARVVPALIQALGAADEGLRKAAVWSLGMIEDPRAVSPLVARLKDR
ncbi:MAG: HEAT repeat domain-containing protein, partial [Gemmatimonadales bacterium]